MTSLPLFLIIAAALLLPGCEAAPDRTGASEDRGISLPSDSGREPAETALPEQARAAAEAVPAPGPGGLIYVPAYSHIYHRERRRSIPLAITLSLRNIDPGSPISIRSVAYYDSAGVLVRSYVEAERVLRPMETIEYVVDEDDASGGAGANFLVEWTGSESAAPPLVEAVMIGTVGQQGISFTSRGVSVERGAARDRRP